MLHGCGIGPSRRVGQANGTANGGDNPNLGSMDERIRRTKPSAGPPASALHLTDGASSRLSRDFRFLDWIADIGGPALAARWAFDMLVGAFFDPLATYLMVRLSHPTSQRFNVQRWATVA